MQAGTTAPATTYTLTTSIDLIDVTGGNVAVINGTIQPDTLAGAVLATVNTGDVINGGTKVDTLNITSTGVTAINQNLIELNSVDVVNVRALAFTDIDAALWDGTTAINSTRSLNDVQVLNVANAVTVGATSTDREIRIDYANNALGSTTATQSFAFDGADGATAVVTYGGTDDITTVAINATGADSDVLIDLSTASLETVNVSGAGVIGIDFAALDDAAVVTFNASANTGGVTYDATAALGLEALTGGTGDDTFTVAGTAVGATIDLGAGDDQLVAGATELDNATTIDGGAGTDTISLAAVTLGNAALIANFENLELTGAAGTYEANLFTNSTISGLVIDDGLATSTTITGLQGTAISLGVNADALDDLRATLATSTGTTDTLAITFGALTGAGLGVGTLYTLTSTGIDTMSIVSGGEDDTVVNSIATGYVDTLNTLSTITITGANDFTLGGVTTNAKTTVTATAEVASSLTAINGSAATGNLDITAGTSTTVTTGGSTETTTYNSLTISTGSGDDVVSIGGRGTVNTGTGADTVEVAVLGVAANVGVDEDIDAIVLGSAADFTLIAGFTSSTRVTTLTNMAADDTISFVAPITSTATTVNNFNTAAAAQSSLVAAINAAIADATSDFDFFTFSGSTYLVGNDATTASVVKLIGTYADFTVAADVVTIG